MTTNPKDPTAPPSFIRIPTAPTPVKLTPQEWEAMTKRRKEEVKKANLPCWLPTRQREDQYKIMVEKLLSGKKSWEKWQGDYEYLFIEIYDFQYLEFFHEINLEDARFNKKVDFVGAKFNKVTSFSQATFAEDATFWATTFAKKASFIITKFDKGANFTGAKFANEVYFTQARFQGSLFFNNAEFYGNEINFSQMTLSSDSNLVFAEAWFDNAVPDFRFLNLTPDIRFHNFSVPSPYELIKKWKGHNEDRYRKLKELAIGGNDHEYELKFYGYEMDSKLINQKNERGWKRFFSLIWLWENFSIIAYKYLSNYGQSMWRPLYWLTALIGYACYIDKLDLFATANSVSSLLLLLNNLDWFDITKTILPLPLFVTDIEAFELAIKMPATAFWFLFFLAVRNKFKIK